MQARQSIGMGTSRSFANGKYTLLQLYHAMVTFRVAEFPVCGGKENFPCRAAVALDARVAMFEGKQANNQAGRANVPSKKAPTLE
jgi:hypothetical protein